MGLLDRFRKPAVAEELCTVLLQATEPEWAKPILASAQTKLTMLEIELIADTFIREKIDVRFAGDAAAGAGHVRIGLKNPKATPAERRVAIEAATAVASALMRAGAIAVIVHPAGEVKFGREQWQHRTQLFGKDGWNPVLAWIDIGNSEGIALTYGLKAFGLPEAGAPSEALFLSGDEAWARAQEALQSAAVKMVAQGAPLKPGETLQVLAGVEQSGMPLRHDNLGLDEPGAVHDTFGDWEVSTAGAALLLKNKAPTPAAMRFTLSQKTPLAMPFPTYRWLFIEAMRARGLEKLAFIWPPQLKGIPAHEVQVYGDRNGRFLITTCGLARVAQPRGTDEDANRFIEYAVELPEHSPKVANGLAFLSLGVHGKDPGAPPIAQNHRVQSAQGVIPFPYDFVVLDALEPLSVGSGAPISLYQPLFMTAEEREQVPVGTIAEWIAKNRAAALARWLKPGEVLPLLT
ncbi:MAG: hypothetical protein QM723_35830 [Myxococcaceae bacterium]